VSADPEQANTARVYDYLLGGAHNFAADREAARRAVAATPILPVAARANRAYLGRVVTWCLQQGIRQFLDLGSGVPTVGNVHEIAHRVDPATRVAYVDVEPVAVAVADDLLRDVPGATVTRADLADPDAVLTAPGVADLLDFSQPVAVLAVAVLHFVPGDVAAMLAAYRRRLVPGSVVAISHGSDDLDDPDLAAMLRAGAESYRGSAMPVNYRSRAEIRGLLADLDVVEPGLVDATNWPVADPSATPSAFYALVGRVP
jgi:hypothetical protein